MGDVVEVACEPGAGQPGHLLGRRSLGEIRSVPGLICKRTFRALYDEPEFPVHRLGGRRGHLPALESAHPSHHDTLLGLLNDHGNLILALAWSQARSGEPSITIAFPL